MNTIDLDAYFKNIYSDLMTKAGTAAGVKIAKLEAQIRTIRSEIEESVTDDFNLRLDMLVESEIITEPMAVAGAKTVGIPRFAKKAKRKVTPAPAEQACSGGSRISSSPTCR